MVFFLWISVILQVFEMLSIVPRFSYLSILRAPRPLIMIRFLRVFLKFSMPKSRINQIFKYVHILHFIFCFFNGLKGIILTFIILFLQTIQSTNLQRNSVFLVFYVFIWVIRGPVFWRVEKPLRNC